MNDRLHDDAPAKAVQAWDSARRLREPIAWTLLALTAIGLLIGAWELLNLPGTPPIATGPTTTAVGAAPPPPTAITFGIRASAVAPQFVADDLFALPIISVLLVAFAGGLTDRARQIVETAIGIQTATLGLGLLTWLGALSGHVRAGIWFITDARELATIAAGLIFTVAVRRSRALRPLAPQIEDFPEDAEDFEVLGEEVAGAAFEDFREEYEGLGEESP